MGLFNFGGLGQVLDAFKGLDDINGLANATVNPNASNLGLNGIWGQRMQEMQEKNKQLEARPKPSKICNPTCPIDDARCQECLQRQRIVRDGFEELEQIERAISNPQMLNNKKFTKCSLCSAPYEKGETECPYCGTEYPHGMISSDLPQSAEELRRLELKRAPEVWAMFSEFRKTQAGVILQEGEDWQKQIMDMMSKMIPDYMDRMDIYKMNLDQLMKGSERYGVSLLGYMYGVMDGTMQSVGSEERLAQEQAQAQAAEAELERRRQEREKQQQIQQQIYERQRQTSNEFWAIQQRRAESSAPHYAAGGGGGGGSLTRSCSDCTYYSPGGQKCGRTGFRTNAGDSCGWFSWKR